MTKAKGFDQINIVFDHLLAYKNYDSETINFIINLTINNWEIRSSFQAQNRLPELVLYNVQLIERDLVQKFISHFPRPNNLISPESKNQYAKARQIYGSYADANSDLVLESFKTKQADLENEMQLQYNIYTQVAQQLQMAKAKVQERTPAFTVVQSPSVPLKKSKPKRMVIIFGIFALTFFVNVIWLMNKDDKKSKK